MSRRVVAVLFGAAIAFGFGLACSGRSTPGEEDPGVPSDSGPVFDAGIMLADAGGEGLPLDVACSAINEARCTFLQRCGLIPGSDQALVECQQYLFATSCGPALWPSRVKQGTLRYHSLLARDCAEGWEGWSCSDWQSRPPACDGLTSAAALLGGACYGGPTTECLEGVCTGGTCPRHCRAPGEVDDLCEADSDCQSPLYCWRTVSGGAVGTCKNPGSPGETCGAQQPCGPGLYCGEFSICAAVHQLGEPCTTGSCGKLAWCRYGAEGATCVARLDQGQRCTDDLQCLSGLLCLEESGTCEPQGPLALGAPCGRRQHCEDGLACVGTGDAAKPPVLGSCAPAVQQGGACTSSFDCAQPLACDPDVDGGTCAARAGAGEDCSTDRDCQFFTRCLKGSCRRLPQPGEPCPYGGCQWGTCEQTLDAGFLCTGGLGANAPCTRNWDCVSLQCVSGACLAACTP